MDDALVELASNAARRAVLQQEKEQLEEQERALIAAAWRAGFEPGEIAAAARRSGAHVRKHRPADVPPAKLGGGAYRPPA